MKPVREWSKAEHFVWEQTCAGKEADFNEREKKKLAPASSPCWGESRRISSEFLETILFEQWFREDVTRKGVIITGAYFPDKLDLEDGHLPWPLNLDHSRLKNGLIMSGLQADRSVSLSGSCVMGKLDMNIISIGSSLYMNDGTFEEISLRGAQIGGQLNMSSATVTGELDMDAVSIGRILLMSKKPTEEANKGATFEEVHLRGARIGGQLGMDGATVRGKLNINAASIGTSLYMRDGATFKKEVNLGRAQIKSHLDMTGATVEGKLDMEASSIGGDLFMRDGNFADVNLHFARVGLSLDFAGGTFQTLGLTGATAEEGLRLIPNKEKPVKWSDLGDQSNRIQLNLQNTKVGALVDTLGSWPDRIKLSGFTYNRLGGFGQENRNEPTERPASDFIDWLSRDKSFSFQPYQQLATVLRNIGKSGAADKVLFAAKDRERQNAPFWKRIGLRILQCGIGYGIGTYTFRVLYWALFFVCLGWFVLCWTEGSLSHKAGSQESIGFWFSLDYLLPIIQLNDAHYENEVLNFCARVYFYFHQIIGYILASLLVAALSGTTKPGK